MPIARTRWTKLYLDTVGHTLQRDAPKAAGSASYAALGDGLAFVSAPFDEETEITGPLAARLFLSSSTADADVFLVFRVFTPDLREVVSWARSTRTRRSPRAGCAPHTASSMPGFPPITGPTMRTTRSSRSRRESRCNSTSRSGPRPSSSRQDTGSRSRCAAGTMNGSTPRGAAVELQE